MFLYVWTGLTPLVTLGVLPPSGLLPNLPTFNASGVAAAGASGSGSHVMLTPASTVVTPAASVTGSAMVPAGCYMGEGMLPVPDRLVKKIVKLEFVEMKELLPETKIREEDESSRSGSAFPRRKIEPVTNILQWVQCFSAMVGVLARVYPQMVPDLMAYQATIVRCYRDFSGLHWAQYDRMYRRQVAVTKDLRWAKLDPTLYSKCFAGNARRQPLCSHCLSDNHSSSECWENQPNIPWSWSAQQSTHQEFYQSWPQSRQQSVQIEQSEGQRGPCYMFNALGGSRCSYNPCKFRHICSECRGKHPRSLCQEAGTKSW